MNNTPAHGTALFLASLATPTASAADETPTAQAFQTYLDRCHAAHVCNGAYLAARDGKTIFIGAVGDAGDAARTPLTIDSAFDINNAQDDSVDDHVALLAALAMGEPASPVRPSIAWALPERLDKDDAPSIAMWFDRELAATPRRYVIDDRDLNQLGYDLLRHKRPADAVTVFGLLTHAYPEKPNGYDSLADGYEALGKRDAAIAAMRKAVSFDPASVQYQRHLAALTDGKD
ncbi:hypothetical protein ACFO8O_09290 [Hephaestia sp. GCM10023244]|uniref:tetratricopeptide repeat protein n=1 Tax=unclassified Hephaestia TaxID=2631281 RepID=UPI00207701B3|nr:hypothetical protein [Hephaestia sp. MAHUQ-44]MCM8731152.1 hypothetical protein [Hephaestia sp. MAHUQ-44]